MGSLWNRSGLVERYADDLRAAGAQAFFFNGGTTTPLTVYRDSAESSAHPNPVVADANGRWPDVFVPYITSFDVQVKTAENVQLTYTLQVPNPDPVDLTVTIDPLEKVSTGMIHAEMVNGTKPGYVRLNGKTIGSSSSSAIGSERTNDDTLDLFIYLWNNLSDTIAPVSGGRGSDGASDFAANKTITLPNWQGAMPIGLDDMGAVAGGFFTGLTFDIGSAIVQGSRTGINGIALTIGNLPAHSHSGTTATEGTHTHTGTTGNQSADHTHTGTSSSDGAHQHDAFIGDDGHTHTLSNATSVYRAAGGATINTTSPTAVATTATLAVGTATADVKVRSTAGNALTADNKVASAGAHTHTMTTGIQSANHTHSFTTGAGSAHSHTFTTDSQGSGTPFNNLGRSVLVTWFIKL